MAEISTGSYRVKVACPLCQEGVTVSLGLWAQLTHTHGADGFLTLEVITGGTTHKCRTQRTLTTDQDAILEQP
jgi:hypothetical protein